MHIRKVSGVWEKRKNIYRFVGRVVGRFIIRFIIRFVVWFVGWANTRQSKRYILDTFVFATVTLTNPVRYTFTTAAAEKKSSHKHQYSKRNISCQRAQVNNITRAHTRKSPLERPGVQQSMVHLPTIGSYFTNSRSIRTGVTMRAGRDLGEGNKVWWEGFAGWTTDSSATIRYAFDATVGITCAGCLCSSNSKS